MLTELIQEQLREFEKPLVELTAYCVEAHKDIERSESELLQTLDDYEAAVKNIKAFLEESMRKVAVEMGKEIKIGKKRDFFGGELDMGFNSAVSEQERLIKNFMS